MTEFRENDLSEQRRELLTNCLQHIQDGNEAVAGELQEAVNPAGYSEKSVRRIINDLRNYAVENGLLKTEEVNVDAPIPAHRWKEVTDKGERWLEE